MTNKGYAVQQGSCGGLLLNKLSGDTDNIKAIQVAEIRVGRYRDTYFEQGASGTRQRPYGAFVHQRNTPFSMKGTTDRKFRINGSRIEPIRLEMQEAGHRTTSKTQFMRRNERKTDNSRLRYRNPKITK
jgi:hypothetical protein